jgi:hypothetical protein
MDLIFGTYRCPDHEPAAFGISEPISKNYLGQMVHPFLLSKTTKAKANPQPHGHPATAADAAPMSYLAASVHK